MEYHQIELWSARMKRINHCRKYSVTFIGRLIQVISTPRWKPFIRSPTFLCVSILLVDQLKQLYVICLINEKKIFFRPLATLFSVCDSQIANATYWASHSFLHKGRKRHLSVRRSNYRHRRSFRIGKSSWLVTCSIGEEFIVFFFLGTNVLFIAYVS